MGTTRHHDWVRHHATARPDAVAVRDLFTGRRLTYAQLDERVDRLAGHLHQLGVRKGDRVALLAYNGSEFFELQSACGRLGSIAVLLNWRLTPHELQYILEDSTPSVLIHDVEFKTTAGRLRAACGTAHLICIDGSDPRSGYERALESATGHLTPQDVGQDDPSALMYTSGTTGHPKGAIITHSMVLWNAINIGIPARVSSESTMLVVLPIFHTGGLNCYANPVLHAGGTVLIHRDPGEALRYLADPSEGVTHFIAVPAVYQALMASPEFDSIDLGRLEAVACGGSPCPEPVANAWAERGAELLQIYGLTETVILVAMTDAAAARRKPGSAGRPLLHTSLRVVGPDGLDVGVGEVGELWAQGPTVTPGYWNEQEANAASFQDGWFRTGDAGRLDHDGFVWIVDRWKDMYKSGGENVYPAEIERTLYQIGDVVEAAVIGTPSERWGETGTAVVVVKPGSELDEAAVLRHCAERLAKFKVPTSVVFTESLPRNATGKILKRELRASVVGRGSAAQGSGKA
jgi:fatty-acyl-CoA synthase